MLSRFSAARPVVMLGAAAIFGGALGCRSATAPAERVFILDIAAARVPCTGFGPQQCLQVRERTDAPYELFYETISGFIYEPGYRYMVRVGERSVPNPPADGSSRAYRLISVLSRTRAAP